MPGIVLLGLFPRISRWVFVETTTSIKIFETPNGFRPHKTYGGYNILPLHVGLACGHNCSTWRLCETASPLLRFDDRRHRRHDLRNAIIGPKHHMKLFIHHLSLPFGCFSQRCRLVAPQLARYSDCRHQYFLTHRRVLLSPAPSRRRATPAPMWSGPPPREQT